MLGGIAAGAEGGKLFAQWLDLKIEPSDD